MPAPLRAAVKFHGRSLKASSRAQCSARFLLGGDSDSRSSTCPPRLVPCRTGYARNIGLPAIQMNGLLGALRERDDISNVEVVTELSGKLKSATK